MLDSDSLEESIKDAITDILPLAISRGMIETLPIQNSDAKETCDKIGKTITDILAEPLASRLADAIDTYVKCADFSGTIITVGSPATQTANIFPGGTPILNGTIPNTLKIQ